MSHRIDISDQNRGFFFAASGNDAEDGKTAERPKATMQAAIDAAALLDPVPTPGLTGSVIASQGGNFPTPIIMTDSVLLDAQNVVLDVNDPISITAANITNYFGTIVVNSFDTGICYQIDGKESFGTQLLYSSCEGANSFIFNILGTCSSIFIKSNSMQVVGSNSIGYNFTGIAATTLFLEADQLDLLGLNAVGIRWAGIGEGNGKINAITNNAIDVIAGVIRIGANTVGIKVESGTYTCALGNCDADVLCEVKSGAVLNLNCIESSGDITVDIGGVLNCIAIKHTGTVTNNGTINGIINGVPFGTYQQKHEEQAVLKADDFTTQNPLGLDMPMQIKFGTAQFGPTDPVELDVLGNITINESDQYTMRVLLEFGRVGAGAFSLLLFRLLINGVQSGDTQYAKISTSDTVTPIEFSGPLDLVATDIVTFEMIRDGSGFDSGGLFPITPSLGTVNDAPSARISLHRNRLVQPI